MTVIIANILYYLGFKRYAIRFAMRADMQKDLGAPMGLLRRQTVYPVCVACGLPCLQSEEGCCEVDLEVAGAFLSRLSDEQLNELASRYLNPTP